VPSDPGSGQVNDFRPPFRWLLTEFVDDEYPVGALPAYGARPALHERVRSGCPRRSLDHVDAFGSEDGAVALSDRAILTPQIFRDEVKAGGRTVISRRTLPAIGPLLS
jgi:hypothetical protein